MLKILKARFQQGHRTGSFPDTAPTLPDRFAGLPEVQVCTEKDCAACAEICPTDAILKGESGIALDMGKCIFCRKCENACAAGKIKLTQNHDTGSFTREGLVRVASSPAYEYELQPNEVIRSLCGKSLKIRQISAGGCAACELDFNVLNTLAWDMGRFGIQVVASPRHADCVLITGPVSKNMLLALKKTFDAVPDPAFVIACGSCAISGGLFRGNEEVCNGVEDILKVDLYVPGCPPHPATLLEALLRFIGRNPGKLRNLTVK